MDYNRIADEVNKSLFRGRISKSQRAGIVRVAKAWERYGPDLDTGMAYALATDYLETGRRMQPVYETFAKSRKQAARRLEHAFKKGQLRWVKTPYWRLSNGHHWVGAGDVQLTHEYNHKGPMREAVLKVFGKDIHKDPDNVMIPEISAFILVEGITRGETARGDFTGKAVENYLTMSKTDYHNARRTVNPADKSSYAKIAGYAVDFEQAIRIARAEVGERFKGPAANPFDGTFNAEVQMVQRMLKAKQYHEIGAQDGRWGSRTAGAVLAFQNDNGLPVNAKPDMAELIGQLGTTAERAIPTARAEATTQDLRDMGSSDIEKGDKMQQAGGAAVLAGSGFGLWDKVSGVTEKVTRPIGEFTDSLYPIKEYIADYLPYVVVAMGGYIIWQAYKSKKNRVEKHRSGEYLSR